MDKLKTSSFGAMLREARLRKGISQRDLSDALGVSNTYISNIENSLKPPFSSKFISQLTRTLEVDPCPFFEQAVRERGRVTLSLTRSLLHQKVGILLKHKWDKLTEEEISRILEIIQS